MEGTTHWKHLDKRCSRQCSGCVVGWGFNAKLRGMEQILPPQNKAGTEVFLRHEPLPSVPDAWHGPEHVKPGHETSLNQYFHKPEPMWAVAREVEGLPGENIDGRQPSMAVRMGGG